MAVAVSSPNTEVLQFDWLISGWVFSILSAQREILKKLACVTGN